MPLVQPLEDAIRSFVEPGMHLHFPSTPSRSNASIIALAGCFRNKKPGFTLSCSGFHSTAHLLPLLDLGRRYIACFYGDNYPIPRPNDLYSELAQRKDVELQFWSFGSYIASLRAGALGLPFAPVRSLLGSTLGEELAKQGMFSETRDPMGGDEKIGLVRPMRPDVVFIHGLMGDEFGNVVFSPPYSEGFWSVFGAKRGAIVTVERIVEPSVIARHRDACPIPAHKIVALCHEPMGAHPQPLYAASRFQAQGYGDDFVEYGFWRRLTSDREALQEFISRVLTAPDRRAAYRAFVGVDRLVGLSAESMNTRDIAPPKPKLVKDDRFVEDHERLVGLAARQIAQVVESKGLVALLAGIGRGYLASRMAKVILGRRSIDVDVLVETGLAGVECGPTGDNFLLSYSNMLRAQRVSSAEHVLGLLTCGANNRCLGVLGAAEIDPTGAINTTRLDNGKVLMGSGGANDIASAADDVVVLVRSTRLVSKVAHVTSPGERVSTIITDLCTFERTGPTSWRVGVVYPAQGGARIEGTIEMIRSRCPWPFEVAEDVMIAPPLSTSELRLIHSLDPTGDLYVVENP
jgi:acyl CoA:acetate/3-ketoacid CoA transferase alpha subunit